MSNLKNRVTIPTDKVVFSDKSQCTQHVYEYSEVKANAQQKHHILMLRQRAGAAGSLSRRTPITMIHHNYRTVIYVVTH